LIFESESSEISLVLQDDFFKLDGGQQVKALLLKACKNDKINEANFAYTTQNKVDAQIEIFLRLQAIE